MRLQRALARPELFNHHFQLDLHDMKSPKVRHAALVFLKMIIVIFTIVFCCMLLEPERNGKKTIGFSDPDSEFTDLQHYSPARTFNISHPHFYLLSCALLPGNIDLVRTIIYQSKAAFITVSARRVLFVTPTINAP
jgi:hypothetical protein